MRILYSFNKPGYEGDCWSREIAAASTTETIFVPFNHQTYLDPVSYADASRLDTLFQARDARLMAMYNDVRDAIRNNAIDAMIVGNCPPYHPEFLRTLEVYKALYSADDPGATYLINIPYLHAYNHVFFVAPTYSADLDMREKMMYAGMKNADWLPISVFDFEHEPSRSWDTLRTQKRDIDIIYVGGFWKQKVELLAKLRRAFGNKFRIYGMFRLKHNIYLNARYGASAWVRPVSHKKRVQLYQRAKIGINIHYNAFGLGNQRLYHLPANGVMQISDCAASLGRVFDVGTEVVSYSQSDELIDKILYYLANDGERVEIARRGYVRTMRDYRFADVTLRAASLIEEGMRRLNWPQHKPAISATPT
jgi:hypothetical protein